MAVTGQPHELFLREHERLLAGVEQIRAAARDIPSLPVSDRAVAVDCVLTFLRHDLGPHAAAEEKFLYPELARLLGNAHALAPMSYDHQMIEKWTAALTKTDLADTVLLQELLFGLHTAIRMHFWKEQEIYFPLIDAEPEEAVRRIVKKMDELEAVARMR
jgi:iron-sulfur cluster repair protein YtfE (RIC family)